MNVSIYISIPSLYSSYTQLSASTVSALLEVGAVHMLYTYQFIPMRIYVYTYLYMFTNQILHMYKHNYIGDHY